MLQSVRIKEFLMKQYAPGKEPKFEREEEKLEDTDINLGNGMLAKLDNFWFYNKWKVLVIVGAIMLFCVMCVQMCGNTEDDLTLMYAGSSYLMTVPNYEEILDTFESVMPEDFDGDGEKRAAFAALNIYSKAQIEEREAQRKEDGSIPPINTHINSQEYNSFNRLMQTGEYSLCLLEEWLYDSVAKGVFCKLSDTLGAQPEYAIDSYAVYFWDTEFAKANAEVFAAIPENTVLCLRMKNSLSNKGSETNHNRAKETFVAILNYKPE